MKTTIVGLLISLGIAPIAQSQEEMTMLEKSGVAMFELAMELTNYDLTVLEDSNGNMLEKCMGPAGKLHNLGANIEFSKLPHQCFEFSQYGKTVYSFLPNYLVQHCINSPKDTDCIDIFGEKSIALFAKQIPLKE